MDKYSIILPNDRAKTYGYVTLFILLTNLFMFAFIYFNTLDTSVTNVSFWGIIISLLSLSILFINRAVKKSYPFLVEISFIILSVCWSLIDKYLLALAIVCFAVIGTYTRRKFEVIFSKEGIIYPSFPKKTFLWKEVSNVVLKDGMLTIDLKNNKLIQSVISKESAVINEREFNLFCKERMLI